MTESNRAGFRARLGQWIESAGPRNFIIALILVNAAILGLETSPAVMQRIGGVLIFINQAVLAVFVIELLIKLYAFGFRFFKSGWNVFDFLVVGIALVPATGPLEVLRALRILRVLRLLSQVQRLRHIIESLMRALPGMGWTAALLLLVFYIFAVMGTMMFRDAFPEYWGTLGRSFFLAVPDHDAGIMVLGHRPAHARGNPAGVDVLRAVHPGLELHGAEPVHRDNRQRDECDTRGRGSRGAAAVAGGTAEDQQPSRAPGTVGRAQIG